MKRAALLLGLVLVVVFAPFMLGGKTMLSSARDVSSIVTTGAVGDSPLLQIQKVIDAGAPAWDTEPLFAIGGHELWREHTLPNWNPYSGLGAPLAGNLQSQPYYPLSFIYSLAPSPYAYNLWVVLRLLVAGLGMFALLRWYVSFFPALLGGTAMMLTGYYIIHYDMPHLSVDVMLPALLCCVEYTLRKPGPASFASMFVVAFCTVSGGMPESTLLLTAFTALYAIFAWFRMLRAGRAVRRGAVTLMSGLALGMAAAAIVLLPFLELWGISFNVHDPNNGAGTFPGASGDLLDVTIGQYLAPLLVGPTRNNIFEGFGGFSNMRGYFGAAAMFFALVGLVDLAYRRFKRQVAPTDGVLLFFACAAVLLVAKRYQFAGINWIGYLPELRYVIFQNYDEALLAVAIAACAAIGLERLLTGAVPRWATIASATTLLATLIALEGAIRPRLSVASHTEYFEWAMTTATLALAVAAFTAIICAGSTRPLRARFLGPAAVAIVAIELACAYIVPIFYVVNTEPALNMNPYRGAPFVSYLQSVAPPDRWRVFGKDGYLFPAWSGVFGLSNVTHLDAVYFRRYLPWVQAFLATGTPADVAIADRFTGVTANNFASERERRLLQLASVRYVVANALGNGPGATTTSTFRRLAVPDAPVYELSPVLSRASLFFSIELRSSGAAALQTITAPRFDVFSRAVVETQAGVRDDDLAALAAAPVMPAQPATIRRYGSSRVEIDARPTKLALLMFNDLNYPGWTATVDGRPAAIVSADFLFRGVVLSPGQHTVVFSYEPASIRVGLIVSISATLIAMAAVTAMVLVGRRRLAAH
jgi:hypothetical protein